MSTPDVPGSNPKNNDQLAMGCWAEHADGSLILVESTEGDRVIYSVFDMGKTPIVEYRDAMPTKGFMDQFSYGKKSPEKWTWHDKTPFPWDKVIKAGARDGQRFASAEDQLNAAERVAESLRLRGQAFKPETQQHRLSRTTERGRAVINTIQDALDANDREEKRLRKALAIAAGTDDETGEFPALGE